MGFPRRVREQILIDTARHCCVCHRYKGVKVEVHHIEQEANGGENTYENAIALCFDCHADAGHYNPHHPRGTKFSPEELRKAKEKWIDLVERHNISQPKVLDSFYCRYFIAKNFEHLVEIADGDLARFPVENPLLVNNSVIESLRKIISKHPHTYRHANARGRALPSLDEYAHLYPDATVPDTSDGGLSYFETVRTPSRGELKELVGEDGLLSIMLDSDLSIEQIAMAVGYRDDCGGTPLQEEYVFRKLWCSFLAVTNISGSPKAIRSLRSALLEGSGFNAFDAASITEKIIPLPRAPVPHNASVLIPLAIILPPFSPLHSNRWSETYDYERHVQVVRHEGVSGGDTSDILTFGDRVFPCSIIYDLDGNNVEQSIHEFDLSNMYTIDRFWECGSCPHIFFRAETLSYARELLAHCCKSIGAESFSIPEGVDELIIAEIEDETTELISISINGVVVRENTFLTKGKYLALPVTPGDHVRVVGQYTPVADGMKDGLHGIMRNELVGEFLNWANRGLTNTYTRTT
ncbi:MAG: HNH endonuclease [Thiogranum sp.]|nr:HNH endonuclease [Thiogranum sp.]